MLPALRYLVSGWTLVLAILTGSMSASSAADPEEADRTIPLTLFPVLFLHMAGRVRTAAAVVVGDHVTLPGAWRSTVLPPGGITDLRVEPLVASAARRLLGGCAT